MMNSLKSGEKKKSEMASEKMSKEESQSWRRASRLNCLIAAKGCHDIELLSTVRLATILGNECTLGAC